MKVEDFFKAMLDTIEQNASDTGEPALDSEVVLSFMGNGASDQLRVGDLRRFVSEGDGTGIGSFVSMFLAGMELDREAEGGELEPDEWLWRFSLPLEEEKLQLTVQEARDFLVSIRDSRNPPA